MARPLSPLMGMHAADPERMKRAVIAQLTASEGNVKASAEAFGSTVGTFRKLLAACNIDANVYRPGTVGAQWAGGVPKALADLWNAVGDTVADAVADAAPVALEDVVEVIADVVTPDAPRVPRSRR